MYVPLWYGMLIVGMAVGGGGQGVAGNSLYFLLSFAVNLKLLFKNCLFKRQKKKKKGCPDPIPKYSNLTGRKWSQSLGMISLKLTK